MELMTKDLDPRVQGFEKNLRLAGTAVVAAVAATVVIVGSLTIIAAGVVVIGALAMVYFLPVASRWMALKKQQGLTVLAETFSEETIRKDEAEEGDRVAEQQGLYKTQSAEIGLIIEELRSNMGTATVEERDLLRGQIDQLEGVLQGALTAVTIKVNALAELKRVNKLYIGFHRAAKVLKSSQDLERNAQQIQQVETARNAIKRSMREAVAGQKLEALNAPLRERLSVSSVAQIASSPTTTIQTLNVKEDVRVPIAR